MSATTDSHNPGEAVPERGQSSTTQEVLPEFRPSWWETGLRARANASVFGVFAELPGLTRRAVRMAWRADRLRTSLVAVATVGAGTMAAFGLLATQRILIELFAAGPTPDRVQAALPALVWLAVVTAVRGGLGMLVGYALNGLTPRVHMLVERELFENTTAVELRAFDDDQFAEGMERATRGTEAAIDLVQTTMNLFAGLVSLVAVTVAVIAVHPLLLLALLVATVPAGYASLRAGHVRFQSYLASSTRRRRQWVLQRLMAERESAAELRSYGLRRFLLRLYDKVMGAQIAEELRVAQRVTTTTSVGALAGGIALAGVYVLLGVLLVRGQIPLAAATTCVIAVQAAQRALAQVTFQIDRVYSSGQFFNEYVRFLATAKSYLPNLVAESGREPDPVPNGLVELTVRDVSLQYPDRDRPAVDQVSLTIRAGETIALVGENGSGKSTLAAMIAGLREPTSGAILWNGRPYDEWDADGLIEYGTHQLLMATGGLYAQLFTLQAAGYQNQPAAVASDAGAA